MAGPTLLDRYRARGLAGRVGFGERPAVVVVDLILGFTDPESPLGADLDAVVEANRVLLATARRGGHPACFTTTTYGPGAREAGFFLAKVPALADLQVGSRWVELDPRLGRREGEPLVDKKYASAFFGTSLASTLRFYGVDTVLVTGATTSGCVRATVVDALQHGFRPIVPEACVGDRAADPHHASLLDIDGKYGDVVSLDKCLALLERSASR